MKQKEWVHEGFVTTGLRKFRWDSFPIRLFQKGKKLGVWDPQEIDLSQDKVLWSALDFSDELRIAKELLLRQISLFQAGEEAVTLDLLPLLYSVAREGYVEEEIYLTSFLFEEAKHTEFFRRYLEEVCGDPEDLSRFHTPSYRKLFYEELPSAMGILYDDPSPENQIRAAVTYNMIVEGVLAETGYYGFLEVLGRNLESFEIPYRWTGLQEGVRWIQKDESRHIAYGIYLIARNLSRNPSLWECVEEQMNKLLPLALGIVEEGFAPYPNLPLPISKDEFISYATSQYQKRYQRLQKARTESLDAVEKGAIELMENA